MARESKMQIRMAAKQEAIDFLRQLYDELLQKVEAGNTFGYGTLNGIALARLEIDTKM